MLTLFNNRLVLAVMAVLSITAIAGYNYAINKHAANVTQNELSKCATNEDCGKEANGKFYCHKSSISDTQEQDTGTCQKVSYATTMSNGIKFYLSNLSFNWFNANRFCKALGVGKRLVNKPVEFGCAANVVMACGSGNTPNIACHNKIFLGLSAVWSVHFWTGNYLNSSGYDMKLGSGCGTLCPKGGCSYHALCR